MATLESKLIVSLRDMVTGPARGIMGTMGRLRAAGNGFIGSQRLAAAPMLGMSRSLVAMGAGYFGVAAGIRGTLGAAIKFEEAFADVRKVVEATDAEFAVMSSTIKQMSRELPLTAVDIAALWAAAGESGIANNELKSFAEMAARVGIAFDMSAGEAGDSLAKLKAQLGLTVAETGDMADAINHLSNNMASKAPQIVEFMLSVGKFAEMGGFHRDQIAAIGSAMISAGADASKAGTAMMNVVRKMTTGEYAKKDQREAAKALGLDLPTIAKQMKKDAPKALKTVLKAIAKAPEEQQIALLSKFFGDEARAFAPLIGNIELLDKALGGVENKTDYAGSALKEYIARASTASNVLQILRNKIGYVFEGVGEGWLPTLKEAATGIGEVLDTLNKRVGVLDNIKAAFQGFMGGIGYGGTGDLRQMMNDIGDLLFGEAFSGSLKDVDERVVGLARLSNRFRDFGKSFREMFQNLSSGDISAALGNIKQAFTDFSAEMSFGSVFGLVVVGGAFRMLAGGILALATSKWGRLFLIASAIATLISAAKDAGSLGEFVDNLKELSALEWVAIAAGIAMLIGPVGRLAGAAGRLARSLGLIKGAGGVKALSDGAKAGGGKAGGKGGAGVTKPTPGTGGKPRSSTGGRPRNWKGPWGESNPRPANTPGPTGPKGLGEQLPKPQATNVMQGLKGMARGGLLAWVANYVGETLIGTGLEQVNKRILEPEQREKAAVEREKWDGLSVLDQIGSIFEGLKPDAGWRRFLLGDAADPNFNFRDSMSMNTGIGGKDGGPSDGSAETNPREVSLLGTPPVSIVGTPTVTITNPPPRPHISISAPITVHGITDLDMIGRHIRSVVNDAASGIQADSEYAAGM